MGWDRLSRTAEAASRFGLDPQVPGAPTRISRCLIRSGHACGRRLGSSQACFVACPTADEIEPLLEAICRELECRGYDPVIAVRERTYGQDVFCTKICGRIIESAFCVTILDDAELDGRRVPNPNVYFEYGLMKALGKHVIPLQRTGMSLAFNIQGLDTVRYTFGALRHEIAAAIDDAICHVSLGPGDAGSLEHFLAMLDDAGFRQSTQPELEALCSNPVFRPFWSDESGLLLLGYVSEAWELEDLEEIFSQCSRAIEVATIRVRTVLEGDETAIRNAQPGRRSVTPAQARRSDTDDERPPLRPLLEDMERYMKLGVATVQSDYVRNMAHADIRKQYPYLKREVPRLAALAQALERPNVVVLPSTAVSQGALEAALQDVALRSAVPYDVGRISDGSILLQNGTSLPLR